MICQIWLKEKNKRQVNGAQIYNEIFIRIKNFNKENIKVVIEQVSAMPGQGVTSMFNFGQSFGSFKRYLFSNAIIHAFCKTSKMEEIF